MATTSGGAPCGYPNAAANPMLPVALAQCLKTFESELQEQAQRMINEKTQALLVAIQEALKAPKDAAPQQVAEAEITNVKFPVEEKHSIVKAITLRAESDELGVFEEGLLTTPAGSAKSLHLSDPDATQAFATLLKFQSEDSKTDKLTENCCLEAVQNLKLGHLGEVEMNRIWCKFKKINQGAPELTSKMFCKSVQQSAVLRGFAEQVTSRAASLEFKVPEAYKYELSTCENYKRDDMDFIGPYVYAREGGKAPKKRDYSWHNNYTHARQSWQDHIVHLATSRHKQQAHPWIVFSAGAMGCGKGYTFETMSKLGHFPIENIVRIDPDFFKQLMPEWNGYVSAGKDAGSLCHKESGYLQELCQEVALRSRQNIWVDGSLRDAAWFQIVFKDIRERFPHYRIAIIYVSASETLVRERIQKRQKETGRGVPEEMLLKSIAGSKNSVFELTKLCDYVAHVTNNKDPKLKTFSIIDRTGTWGNLKNRFGDLEPAPHEFPNALAPIILKPTGIKCKSCPQDTTSTSLCGKFVTLEINDTTCTFAAGSITPATRIVIPDDAAGSYLRQCMGIPEHAAWISYFNPDRGSTSHGGFALFDDKKKLLQDHFLAIAGHNVDESTHSLEFSAPVELQPNDIPESLLDEKRWADITVQTLLDCGAHRYAWVCDDELPSVKFIGGFLYSLDDSKFVLFPVRMPFR